MSPLPHHYYLFCCFFRFHARTNRSMSPLPHHPVFLLHQCLLSTSIISADLPVFNVIILGRLLISIIEGFANVGGSISEVNEGNRGDLQRCNTGALLVEETIVHSLSQKIDNLFLNKPVSLELMVSLLPADNIIVITLLNARNSLESSMIPRISLTLHGLNHILSEPINRSKDHRVKSFDKSSQSWVIMTEGWFSFSITRHVLQSLLSKLSCRSESSNISL